MADIFEKIREIGKTPIIAQIGGFRPEENIHSWFGGNFLLKPNSLWPQDCDGYMLPLIQINVSEVPEGSVYFGDSKLVQIFINSKKLPSTPAKDGDGWRIVQYKSLDDMKSVSTPDGCSTLKPFQIKWSLFSKADYPCWEECWDYFDLSEIQSNDQTDMFFEEFDRYSHTKIGGYASFIQSPNLHKFEYVIQIASEQKPNFMVADNGNIYILKSKADGEWFLEWDCY